MAAKDPEGLKTGEEEAAEEREGSSTLEGVTDGTSPMAKILTVEE